VAGIRAELEAGGLSLADINTNEVQLAKCQRNFRNS